MILVTRAVSPGWYYFTERKKLMFDPERVEIDKQISDIERTVTVFSQVANSINDNIQVTVDHPDKHLDRKMPVLDLKVWVSSGQTPKVLHTFYKKPVASPYTIMKRSAILESTKRNTIFRRLQHVSPECGLEECAKHLTEYSQTLRLSGYS